MTTHLTHRLGAGLLAGVVLVGGTTGALAAKGTKVHANRAVATGLVSNLSATGFTLTRTTKATATTAAAIKTTQVALNATVKERATKGTTGALANGEYALVVGQKTTAGITAKRVVFSTECKGSPACGPPAGSRPHRHGECRHTGGHRHHLQSG